MIRPGTLPAVLLAVLAVHATLAASAVRCPLGIPVPVERLSTVSLRDAALPLPRARLWPQREAAAADSSVACSYARGLVLLRCAGEAHVRALPVSAGHEREACDVLGGRGDVLFAQPDYLRVRQHEPDDPLLTSQWHHVAIRSREAWDRGRGSPDVRIAIVDSPFQMDHPDLAANTDPGWDLVNEAWIFSHLPYAPDPYIDHATLSAGMAAAVVGNGLGVAGAGNCRVLPIRVVYGWESELYAAVVWAADQGVRIVNLSWTGADSAVLNTAGEYLRNTCDGVLCMSGINGSGRLNYPDHPYITVVSMTDSGDAMVSRHGPYIDFAAPGQQVFGTMSGSGYDSASGTSYAAPLVGGVLGVLFSVNPNLGAARALRLLELSAADLGTPGRDEYYGWGRVDFGAAAWLAAATRETAQPALVITAVNVSSNSVSVETELHAGLEYGLERCGDLAAGGWSGVAAVAETNGSDIVLSDQAVPAGGAHYRVVGIVPE